MSSKPDLAALFGATESKTFLGLEVCEDLDRIDASSAFVGAPVRHLMDRLAHMRKTALPRCERPLVHLRQMSTGTILTLVDQHSQKEPNAQSIVAICLGPTAILLRIGKPYGKPCQKSSAATSFQL